MIYSMTGFASKAVTLTSPDNGKATLTINLKAVNSRFFEVTFRLPYQISSLETELDKRLKQQLFRGHINFSVQLDNPSFFKGAVQPALNTIDGYVQAITAIKEKTGLSQDVTLDQILQLPNIFAIEDRNLDDASKQAIFDHVQALIEEVLEARKQEGARLLTDIHTRINSMDRGIAVIETRAQEMIEQQKAKINSVMQELQGDSNALADMRKNALFALLDKMDIHEEIIRFKSHTENIKKQIAAPGMEKGKKLDFTLQELGREINTITAKCSDALISSHAIDIKVEIEKAREQIQNIV
jgi:uncharacterized protein (TIGR00255 family)